MRIGIDLDGVIFDLMEEILKRWNRDHDTTLTQEDMTHYDALIELGGDKKYFTRWWAKQIHSGMLLQARMYPGARDFLEEVSNLGDVIIVTSRMAVQPRVFQDTAESLAYYNVPFKELHFTYEKYFIDCDVFIEDSPEIVEDLLGRGILVFAPVRPWNENHIHPVHCFEDWDRLLKLIKRVAGNGDGSVE